MQSPTDALKTTKPLSQKVEQLLALKQITPEHTAALTPDEYKEFGAEINRLFATLTGKQLDQLQHKIDPIIPSDSRSELWESNHRRITNAINAHLQRYGTMPGRTLLAEQTGLSRQTIHKHVKEYEQNANYLAQQAQLKFMSSHVLGTVLKKAMQGDTQAAKLYFSMVGSQPAPAPATLVQTNNNYIQINNTVLSQQKLNQLTPAQLAAIEGIINTQLQPPQLQQPAPAEE